jgi:hypothetical protein
MADQDATLQDVWRLLGSLNRRMVGLAARRGRAATRRQVAAGTCPRGEAMNAKITGC